MERTRDGLPTPKKARIFFSEDQKEALRLAYNQDPYPNQSTIEFLANELGVNNKTIVNWFHNHRMRAKQQNHAYSSPNVRQSPTTYSVKTEGSDECSNQSDSISLSSESQYRVMQQSSETSQWLFPTFEAVNPERRPSESSLASEASSTLNGISGRGVGSRRRFGHRERESREKRNAAPSAHPAQPGGQQEEMCQAKVGVPGHPAGPQPPGRVHLGRTRGPQHTKGHAPTGGRSPGSLHEIRSVLGARIGGRRRSQRGGHLRELGEQLREKTKKSKHSKREFKV